MRRLHYLASLIVAASLAGCRADAQAPATEPDAGGKNLAPTSTAGGRATAPVPAGEARPTGPEATAEETRREEARREDVRRAEAPAPEPVTIPKGTALPLVFETAVSSATSRPGDLVVARLASDVRVGGRTVLPARSEVRGRVATAVPSGRVKGRARLAVTFDRLIVDGSERPIEATTIDVTARSAKKRDAAIIGGSTGAGVVIGAIAGGKKGAVVGGVVGAGAGTGAVLATKGKEVSFPAGYRRTVQLTQALTLR
jgi:hypothetical protein